MCAVSLCRSTCSTLFYKGAYDANYNPHAGDGAQYERMPPAVHEKYTDEQLAACAKAFDSSFFGGAEQEGGDAQQGGSAQQGGGAQQSGDAQQADGGAQPEGDGAQPQDGDYNDYEEQEQMFYDNAYGGDANFMPDWGDEQEYPPKSPGTPPEECRGVQSMMDIMEGVAALSEEFERANKPKTKPRPKPKADVHTEPEQSTTAASAQTTPAAVPKYSGAQATPAAPPAKAFPGSCQPPPKAAVQEPPPPKNPPKSKPADEDVEMTEEPSAQSAQACRDGEPPKLPPPEYVLQRFSKAASKPPPRPTPEPQAAQDHQAKDVQTKTADLLSYVMETPGSEASDNGSKLHIVLNLSSPRSNTPPAKAAQPYPLFKSSPPPSLSVSHAACTPEAISTGVEDLIDLADPPLIDTSYTAAAVPAPEPPPMLDLISPPTVAAQEGDDSPVHTENASMTTDASPVQPESAPVHTGTTSVNTEASQEPASVHKETATGNSEAQEQQDGSHDVHMENDSVHNEAPVHTTEAVDKKWEPLQALKPEWEAQRQGAGDMWCMPKLVPNNAQPRQRGQPPPPIDEEAAAMCDFLVWLDQTHDQETNTAAQSSQAEGAEAQRP